MNLENLLRKKEHCGLYICFRAIFGFQPDLLVGCVCVWTFSKEVKLVQCMSFSFHFSWNFSSLIDVFQPMLVIFTSTCWGISISGGDSYFNKQGGNAYLTVIAQRRHCQRMVIWKRDVSSTYLQPFRKHGDPC